MPVSSTQISKTIQDITPMMVLSVDKITQLIVFSNNSFTEVIGFQSDELLESNIYTYLQNDSYICFADAIELLKSSNEGVIEFEITLLGIDGEEIKTLSLEITEMTTT